MAIAVITNTAESLEYDILVDNYLVQYRDIKNTYSAKFGDLKRFREFLVSKLNRAPIGADLTSSAVREFVEDHIGKNFSQASVLRRLNTIKNFSRFLFERHKMFHFALGVQYRTVSSFEFVGLTSTDREKLVAALPKLGIRDRFTISLLLYSGLRCAEARALNLEDMDENTIVVRKGKGNKFRKVPVSKDLKAAYFQYLVFRQGFGPQDPKSALLIGIERVTPRLNSKTIWRICNKAMLEAGVDAEMCSPHKLRHSFAKNVLLVLTKHEQYKNDCGPLLLLSEWLGHSSIEMTRRYLRSSDSEHQRAMSLI